MEETTLQADVDVSDESSDVEDASTTYVPPAKKFRRKTSRDIRFIKEEMLSLRASIQRIVPACLKDQLTTVFRCCICRTVPIRPPIVVSSCCGNILGCKGCIDQLMTEDDSTELQCPLCRSTEFSASRLNGLDGVMSAFDSYSHITAREADD